MFVPIKTEEQLDLQALHRVRERWVMRRTAFVNQHGPESVTPLKVEYIGADQLPLLIFRLQLCGGPYIQIRPASSTGQWDSCD